MVKGKKQAKALAKAERQQQDRALLVTIPNKPLDNFVGEPFRLRNLQIDESLIMDIEMGYVKVLRPGAEIPDEDEGVEDYVYRDDPRIQPLIHANTADMIENFLRSRDNARNPQNPPNLVVDSDADSRRAVDIGKCIEKSRGNGVLVLTRSDLRWLRDKMKDRGYKAFPVDAPLFCDLLNSVYEVAEEPEEPEEPEKQEE